MKFLPLLLCVFISSAVAVRAQDHSSLPFPVSIDGQAATAKAGEPFAKIAKPVSNTGAIEVGAKGDMTIINVTPASAKGELTPGGATAIILLQGATKSSLEKTMDKQKLKSGNYLMSVVADGKTASILMQVQ